MIDIDDKSNIRRVLDGDTSSFSWLVEKYKDMVFTVCFRILRQREDAEDAAQNVFIKAFRNLHSFNGDAKFSTWLYTIAYRTAISKTQLQKIKTVSDDFQVDISTEVTFPQVELLKNQEQEQYVKQAISELPEIEGVIISLYYLDENSIQEIVEITSLTASNVKVKLHRARKQLKTTLEAMLHQETKSII